MKKYWLMIIFVIILGIGILFWYFDYQLPKTNSESKAGETKKESSENKETRDKDLKSIPLEKPPFIKD